MAFAKYKPAALAGAVAVFGVAAAMAQQAYDPMRPAPVGQPAVSQDAEAVATDPEFENLPIGEGMEETYYQCVACHSTSIIKQQRLSDARWDYLWDWMIEDQGMLDTDEETKELILTYLKQHFSSER